MTFLSDGAVERLRRAAELPDLSETRYRAVREIGRGGMGTVYLAEDLSLGREVALKVLRAAEPEAAARMLQEARILARLEHPGIVPVHDAGTLPDGRVFYAMKLVRGRRLDDHLRAEPALAGRLRVFMQVCEAVAFAHARGVVHRDLKPENVMIGAFGEVLVLDWGVAKILAAPEADLTGAGAEFREPGPDTTASGAVIGTPAYMAPEQAEGRSEEIDGRTDVWALGAILVFVLTGRPPDSGSAISGGRGPIGRAGGKETIPRALASVSRKALARDPSDRYGTAGELAREVARYLDGIRVEAHRETLWEKLARLGFRYRTPILLVVTYLLMRSLLILFTGR